MKICMIYYFFNESKETYRIIAILHVTNPLARDEPLLELKKSSLLQKQ